VIFLTVGTQLPFDRLVRGMDDWAAAHPDTEVFGQIGPASYRPRHFNHAEFLPPDEIDEHFRRAQVIVAHAGVGSIVSSLTLRKPIIVMPRRQALGEHRSDHQVATARWLEEELRLNIALDVPSLLAMLEQRELLQPGLEIGERAQPALIDALQLFVGRQRRPSTLRGFANWIGTLPRFMRETAETRRARS